MRRFSADKEAEPQFCRNFATAKLRLCSLIIDFFRIRIYNYKGKFYQERKSFSMKIRRMAAMLMGILLVLSMCSCAFADEAARTPDYVISNASVTMNRYNNTLAVSNYNTGRVELWDANGNVLTTENYTTMTVNSELFEVRVNNDVNGIGMIDAAGKTLVPMQYGDVFRISDRWQAGAVLVDATAENYDYKSSGSTTSYYLVDHYDIYYRGAKAGELGRLAFDPYAAYGRGDYLYVCDKERNYTYYNKEMVASGYESDSSSEYDVIKNKVYHKGSNQQAFTASCTLTSDEVELDIYEIDGRFLDLQGNVVFTPDPKYTSIYNFNGEYARVYMSSISKYGLIDRTGREILACEYSSPVTSSMQTYFEGGYQPLVKDGKFGYANTNGEITCEFKYPDNVVKSTYKMPFTHLNDLTGDVIVLSAAVGELPGRYTEVSFGMDGCPVFAAETGKDNAGVVNLKGEIVVPFDETYDDCYDFTLSHDGSIVMGYAGSRTYNIYLLTDDEKGIAASTAADATEPTVTEPDATTTEDNTGKTTGSKVGTWKCTNGHTNTGKFCSECGEARPEEETVVKCAKCGYQPEGTTPKFCPECGNAF